MAQNHLQTPIDHNLIACHRWPPDYTFSNVALVTGALAVGGIAWIIKGDGAGGAATDRAIAFNYPGDTADGKGTGKANAGSCTLKVYGVASDGSAIRLPNSI